MSFRSWSFKTQSDIPIYLSCILSYAAFITITLYAIHVPHARTSILSCSMGRNLSRMDLHWELGWLVAREGVKVRWPCKIDSFPDCLLHHKKSVFVLRLSTGTRYDTSKYPSLTSEERRRDAVRTSPLQKLEGALEWTEIRHPKTFQNVEINCFKSTSEISVELESTRGSTKAVSRC